MAFGGDNRVGLSPGLVSLATLSSRATSAPTLALNFLSDALDNRVTFTRGSTATFTGSNGLIQTAAIDAPRFDYDPVTLAPKGLLIEEQRTNLVLQSNAFTTTWAWDGGSAGTTAQNAVSPEGSTNAWTVTDTSATVSQAIQQQSNLTAANHTLSCYVKKTTGAQSTYPVLYAINAGNLNAAFCTVDTTNGIATPWTAFPGITIVTTTTTCTDAGNYWRVTLTFLGQAAFWLSRIVPAATPNATQSTGPFTASLTGSTVIYGAQLEAGAFATSYIPTVASQVTRTADTPAIVAPMFAPWYNQSAGTMVCNFAMEGLAPSGTSDVWLINDGTSSNNIRLRQGTVITGADVTMSTGGVIQVDSNSFALTADVTAKSAFAWSTASSNLTANGTSLGDGGAITPPTVNQLVLTGSNKWLRSISFYPSRLPNAQLQALTA